MSGRLDSLEQVLSSGSAAVDITKAQETLFEISRLVHEENALAAGLDHQCTLQRLIRIYSEGISSHDRKAFVCTATDYAKIIEKISQAFPHFDYSEAVSQLLFYMNQLFRFRKTSWITVYEHIISMPDSIEVVKLLKNEYFSEVQEWVESGVRNLFQIKVDLFDGRDRLADEIANIDAVILGKQRKIQALMQDQGPLESQKVINLQERVIARQIQALKEDRAQLVHEVNGKDSIIELIESNIQEFEDKLKALRRQFLCRLVYVADDSTGSTSGENSTSQGFEVAKADPRSCWCPVKLVVTDFDA